MERTRNVLLVCLVLTFVVYTFAETASNNECTSQQTCAECIRTPHCVWCSEERNISKTDKRVRCMNKDTIPATKSSPWCPKQMIVDPPQYTEVGKNLPFSSVKDEQVQVTPQRVKMFLRRGQEETLKIRYKQAEDYPVDLYFLMDLSASMEKHKDNLSKLGYKLVAAMTNLTSNFRLGFGSFVDKVLLPMTNNQTRWLENHCILKKPGAKCAPPYGYKHKMKLTSDVAEFEANVQSAPISGNLDSPEGGLDATMQAMICWDHIGWRKNARHILVYSTDATYHIAGDGRLAGLVEPNDEQCHLDADGSYTHAELLDYPSISQIHKQAQEKNINIIFAVVENMVDTYEELSKRINGSSVGIFDDNSDNVVDLVRSQYEKLTNTITMTHNDTGPLELKYFTKCLNRDGPLQERKECSGVRVDTTLEFEVKIKAVDCPQKMEDWHRTIEIKPMGVNEAVIIEVELHCDCECSRPGHEQYVANSTKCDENGDLTCGVCACKEPYSGKRCDCQDDDGEQGVISEEPCRNKGKVCSGQGVCRCGICKCKRGPDKGDKFYGEFCQCDNFSCARFNDQVCGGPDRGRCECGTCVCKPGLGGDDCHCRTSNSTCMPPGENTKECNGFGKCECGSCICTTEGRGGEFCEVCPTCPSERCDELKDCIECQAYKTGPEYVEGKDCSSCANVDTELVDDIDENPNAKHPPGTHVCVVRDSSGCSFVFTYEDGRGDTVISTAKAEKSKKCPEPTFSAYGVAGGAIGVTLFLGLIGLLIWKVLTMFHDHREWVKFEKERVCANWERGENPLFKEPTTSFKNPTFDADGVKG